jgi:polyphenol oxidase
MIDVTTAKTLAGTRHGFLGRHGGVSTGLVAGLNVGLGSGDEPSAVAENRRRAVDAVAHGARLVTVYQVHSPDAVVADIWSDDARPRADAIVTDRPGLVLGIVTADCAPVLFFDREAQVIAAAHAGWKGAIGGVTDATIDAMERRGATRDRIVAVIGPCIARASYEVDAAFVTRFVEADPANDCFFADGKRAGHHQFDLEAYVAHRLAVAGVMRIETLGLDTYSQPDRFFSFRRATHMGEPDYGRQISLIALA